MFLSKERALPTGGAFLHCPDANSALFASVSFGYAARRPPQAGYLPVEIFSQKSELPNNSGAASIQYPIAQPSFRLSLAPK